MRLGIDVGGTFIDLVCVSDEGELRVAKVTSDAADPIGAIEAGLEYMGWSLGDVHDVILGTTLATNTVIEKAGARTALLCTEGFRDILELQRWHRRYLYDLQQTKPEPLVDRQRRFGVPERVSADGSVIRPVDAAAIERICSELMEAGVESVAICFLNAHQNGQNEVQARELIRKCGGPRFVSLSSEVSPLIREWERTSTTVVNAYVQPVIHEYLARFESGLLQVSSNAHLAVMQSNGGIASVQQAVANPVRTVLSGPAAGVASAALAGREAGFRELITMDMGGTSCDVAVIQYGEPEVTKEGRVEYNLPITVPMLKIASIGAGGGSLVWVDYGGAVKVGPGSAGAYPGPACYDRGGSRPTLTDAQLVLGRLPEAGLLGGQMAVRPDLAERAIGTVCAQVDLSLHDLAAGVVWIASAKMAEAIRVATINRGLDPRDYTLLAFGGAGPLHACEIASELGILRVLIPPTPGVFSALGLVRAGVKVDRIRSLNVSGDTLPPHELDICFCELERECRTLLESHGVAVPLQVVQRNLNLRYPGQSFEVTVLAPERTITAAVLAAILTRFHERHAELYSYAMPDEAPFIVSAEVSVREQVSAVASEQQPMARRPQSPVTQAGTAARSRRVFLLSHTGWATVPVYLRTGLMPGQRVDGPAVIDQLDSTVLIESDYEGQIDGAHNLILTRRSK